VEYAIYLAKRTLKNKQRHALEDYELVRKFVVAISKNSLLDFLKAEKKKERKQTVLFLQEALNSLRKNLQNKWNVIQFQAEEQVNMTIRNYIYIYIGFIYFPTIVYEERV